MDKETRKKLATALKTKREKLGMSLRDVCEEVELSPSTVWRIENELGSPDAGNLSRLADWLEIPLDQLLHGEKEETAPVISYLCGEMPEIVRLHLINDKNLTPENAERLAEIFRVSYQQFTDYSKEGGK